MDWVQDDCANAIDEVRADDEPIVEQVAEFSDNEVVEDIDTSDACPQPNTT